MNIACVVDRVSRHAGGLFESVRRLAQSLMKGDCDVMAFGIEDRDTVADSAKWTPVPVRTYPPMFNREWGYANQLLPDLVSGDFDVLLTHGLWKYSSVASHSWHRKTGRPYIIHPHGMLEAWALRNSWWKKRIAALLYEDRHLH